MLNGKNGKNLGKNPIPLDLINNSNISYDALVVQLGSSRKKSQEFLMIFELNLYDRAF